MPQTHPPRSGMPDPAPTVDIKANNCHNHFALQIPSNHYINSAQIWNMTSIQLPIMTLQDSLYRSPKRKRGSIDSDTITSSHLITSGFRRSLDQLRTERLDTQSPSTKVTGKFQKLRLQSPVEQSSLRCWTSPSGGKSEHHGPQQTSLQEVTPPMTEPNGEGNQVPINPPKASTFTFKAPAPHSSPWSRSRKSSKSPPPSSSLSEQFWQESEITGYSPEDPDEDDYGVNGVGYQKTPAVAYAISQRRKQQIAEYRSRETKEARQRRGERRLKARHSASPQPSKSLGASRATDRKATRTVHFANG